MLSPSFPHRHLAQHYRVLGKVFPWGEYERTRVGAGFLSRHPLAPRKYGHEQRDERALARFGHEVISLPENYSQQPSGNPPDLVLDGIFSSLKHRDLSQATEPMRRVIRAARKATPGIVYILGYDVQPSLPALQRLFGEATQDDEP